MKTNVLQVIGALNIGGAETMLLNILKTINHDRYKFYFLCYSEETFDYEEDIKQYGGEIIRIKALKEVGPARFIKQIEDIIRTKNIDVVHCHTYYNSMFAVMAAKKCGVKTIITHSHNTKAGVSMSILKKIYFSFSKRILNRYSTDLMACGPEAGKALFGNNKFAIFDNGIVLEDFAYDQEKRKRIRKELGIKETTTVFGHVGRFSEQKNHEFLIKVFYEYQKKNPNSCLVLLGQGHLMDTIKGMVANKGIEDKVLFVGIKKNAKDYYNAFDAFLFPSLYEGLPVVLVEAQMNGLPIYASDTIDKNVDESETILFIPINSAKKWADIIFEKELRRFNNEEKMINSKYNIVKNVAMLEKVYDKSKIISSSDK